jgi:hypothetical protein
MLSFIRCLKTDYALAQISTLNVAKKRLRVQIINFLPEFLINKAVFLLWIRDSSVGIATGFGRNGRGYIPSRDKRFFSTPQSSFSFLGPPSLLTDICRELFPRDKVAET